ncbi:MAG TPA: extracellular solute-binding protein [Vitreimonas sp.]|nr:extracellular solute-binding protein [Vitreimonas sp.]
MSLALTRRLPAGLRCLVPFVVVAVISAAACNPDADRNQDGGGTAPPAATSEPGGSPDSGASPGGSPDASPGTQLSGTLLVGAKYQDADEIATVRYDTFKDQYPEVDVQFTEADFDPQQFLTAVASGDAPDVVQMDRGIIGTYISQGALEPLDECISSAGIDMGQYREAAVAAVTYDGQIWGIPQFYDTRIVMINDSVLADVGLTPDDIDTSDWDRLAEVNEQMLARDGGQLTRLGFDPKLPDFLPMWAAANGASMLSEDGTESLLDDPKVAEALEFTAGLIKAHGSAADFTDLRANGPGSAFFGPENQFTEDSLGAMPMEQWYLNVMAGDTPDEEVSFRPFKDRQGNNLTMAGGSAWVIPSGSENMEAACEFARVVTLADTWYAASKARADTRASEGKPFTGTYTANTAADERIFGELVSEETAGRFHEGVQLAVETADSAITIPPTPAAEEFRRIWNDAVQRVINGEASAVDALAEADQEAQAAIDNAR